jgi:peptidoglycan/xylan/chitin deacetylase (PgdA/CDA1 family)
LLRFLLLLTCVLGALGGARAAGTAAAAAGPVFAPMTLSIANFATDGVEASLGGAAAQLLRQGLAGSPVLDLHDSQHVRELLANNAGRVLGNRPGVAQSVAEQVQCRVLVYGMLWADATGARFVQVIGVDCRPRVARIYATPPLDWPATEADQQARLLSALQAVLPPVGRVISVVSADNKTQIQIFPVGKTAEQYPLHSDTLYLAYHAQGGADNSGRPDFLAPLWNGDFSGRLTTGPQRLDDVINATPEDASQIQALDLVGLALTREVAAIPSTGRLVLSDPPYARVIKDGKTLGLTPVLLAADSVPGDFTLALTNYEQQPITLAAATGLLADEFSLKELPLVGALRVTSDPDGATVLLDGKEVGKTPLVYPNVQPGPHTVAVRLAGYANAEQALQVARAQAAVATFTLERQRRDVRVVSQPAGAEVSWDGQDQGPAPAAIARATVGTHQVKVTLAGYDAVEKDVDLPAGDQPAELSFPLAKIVGGLKITSEPGQAQITVAGQARGAAPVELAGLTPGDYEVTASLAGYRDATQTVTVKAHETAELTINLALKVGSVDIKTVPAGAKIVLDGQDRGVTPAKLDDLRAGEHKLHLELANLRPWDGKITVKDGETTQVQVGLLPLQMQMETQPGVRPAPVSPGASAPPGKPSPNPFAVAPPSTPPLQLYEGQEEPGSFAQMDVSDGQEHSWSLPLLREGDTAATASDQVKLGFLPHADGSLTVAIRTRQALPTRMDLTHEDGLVVASLPGLQAIHNPSGVSVEAAPLRGVRLTNTGPDHCLQLTLTLATGAQLTTSGRPEASGELLLNIRRPALKGYAKQVALTFDDTPFVGYTARLLQLLREYRVVATFFVIGHKAVDMPNLIRQAHDDGHLIENHSMTHPKLTSLAPAQVKFELQRCDEIIQQITGRAPGYYRPPGGDDNGYVMGIAKEIGLTPCGWDVDIHDYDTPSAQLIADRVVTRTHAGDIILLHDGVEATLQALPAIITRLREEGFRFVLLNELLATPGLPLGGEE